MDEPLHSRASLIALPSGRKQAINEHGCDGQKKPGGLHRFGAESSNVRRVISTVQCREDQYVYCRPSDNVWPLETAEAEPGADAVRTRVEAS